jgi:hypothetical protein
MRKTVGVLSDTHGLLRPQVAELLKEVDWILHAGDIGSPEVLDGLKRIAPLTAIRGNNDTAVWAKKIPETKTIRIGSILVYMLHNVKELDIDPSSAGFQVVISGHSHRPSIEWKDDILFLNPGSAGPRRFKLPVSIARLTLDGRDVRAELLDVPA